MSILRRLPALVALLLLGALALRLGLPFLLAVPLTAILLVALFTRPRAVQMTLAAILWAGALAWVGMGWMRVQQRLAEGLAWNRLALILGAVALFTAWAAWLLHPRKAEG